MDTQAKYTTRTDGNCIYRFSNLPPGHYRLETQSAHFKRFVRQPIDMQVNNALAIDVQLLPGEVNQEIVVSGQTPLVQPESSSLGEVVETRAANELPLNGRNPIALVALVPGVVTQNQFGGNTVTMNSFASGNFQVNGGVAEQNAGYWDGAPMNASGYINELAILPTQDAIESSR
jgi:hypothetical protein